MSIRPFFRALILLLYVPAFARSADPPLPRPQTRNIILVTTDGLRCEEVFGGAEASLLNHATVNPRELDSMRDEFLVGNSAERRQALLPFLWGVIAREGQLFGNVDAGSEVKVTNGKNFSYPGYNEIFTGVPDPGIDSNEKKPNPNVTVLEWLHRQDEFKSRIAAFGSWDVFPYILHQGRSGLKVVAGWNPDTGSGLAEKEELIAALVRETPRMWPQCCYDSFTFHAADEYFKRQRPRVLYIGFGETDEFAHMGRYGQYLRAAHRVDGFLNAIWEEVQRLPDFRARTTLIVTTDHGRGGPPVEWRSHGAKIKGSDRIWIGVLGPDTPALGERTGIPPLTQSQIAATLAALLGYDYQKFQPKAGAPIASVLPSPESSHAPRRSRPER
jgi:hypothetical protein